MKLSYTHIAPFLNTSKNKTGKWLGYIGLGIGVLLLLGAFQMYINLNELLKEKNTKKTGYDYISITKTITDQNMAQDNRFTNEDLKNIQAQSFIEDAAPLIANQFRVKASAGNILPFSTDLFLESINEKFIDTVPPSFNWKEGQEDVPIIFSSDFLEMYNVFAPSQDLPQLSAHTISSVKINLECYSPLGIKNFRGQIVAISDRINSVLVPQSFMLMANKNFGGVSNVPASRIYLKTKDANNTQLLNFIQQKNYHINKDKTKFGRIKQILQAIITSLAGFGVLVILLALLLFSFYLQLMIEKSKENLQLLLTLGFSPQWLSTTVSKKWVPVYILIILSALIITDFLQFCFQHFVMNGTEALSIFVHGMVVVLAAVLIILCVAINQQLIKKQLNKLG